MVKLFSTKGTSALNYIIFSGCLLFSTACGMCLCMKLSTMWIFKMLVVSLFFTFLVFFVLVSFYFFLPSRYSYLVNFFSLKVGGILGSPSFLWVVYILFLFLLITNLSGNFPLSSVPTLFYSETLTLSLSFWVPIMVCVSVTQLKGFMSHMLPYGSPASLMFFLPLVEIFSQLIRPFTLMIRLSTNLSSGHIMLYIFSYFTLLSDFLAPVISVVLGVLFVLEICISALQAYIFFTLVSLYIVETV